MMLALMLLIQLTCVDISNKLKLERAHLLGSLGAQPLLRAGLHV